MSGVNARSGRDAEDSEPRSATAARSPCRIDEAARRIAEENPQGVVDAVAGFDARP